MKCRSAFLTFAIAVLLAGFIALAVNGKWSATAYAQTDQQSNQSQPTYWVYINPGSTENPAQHFSPSHVSVPAGTTVQWIHNDLGVIHTVTSGVPGNTDTGSQFDSGDMRFGATFDLTFGNFTGLVGNVPYYCTIHPWVNGAIYSDSTVVSGDYFKMASGAGPILDVSKSNRTVFTFIPIVPEQQNSGPFPSNPVFYNLTLKNGSNETIFSDQFGVPETNLQVEIVQTVVESNSTADSPRITSDAGGFHVEGNIFNEPGNYTFVVQLASVGSARPTQDVTDEFQISVVSRPAA